MYYFVYCGNKMHRISVSSGKLVLHDHTPDEIEIELAMGTLGSDNNMCPCAQIYKIWKHKKYSELPNILKEELNYEN